MNGSVNDQPDLDSATSQPIQRNRIRAPRSHGEALVVPPPAEISQLWNRNLQTIQDHNFLVNGQPISQLRSEARNHLIFSAQSYSSQYCDGYDLDITPTTGVIMSGHQPRLFHPGVWFKNWALSDLGAQFGATAINLIVDNDLCGHPTISVPKILGEWRAGIVTVAYDKAGGNIPFENCKIQDPEMFESFSRRVSAAISPVIDSPLVQPLWQHALNYCDPQKRLGHTLAAARHRLEFDLGLRTYEIPLSEVCRSEPFAHFLIEISNRIEEFQQIYNGSLLEYRDVNRIRSNAHPVPALDQVDEWFEIPFWVWTDENPMRRALFVRNLGKQIEYSDRGEWSLILSSEDAVNQITELSKLGIAVRPRALMTTMYSRTFLSDLFIHGIGGAKYDQLTDAIIARFWSIAPAAYLTATATFTLPFDFEPVTSSDITADSVRLREMEFHPEQFVDANDESAQVLIKEKQDWIAFSSDRKQRHDAITRCNESLQKLILDQARKTKAAIENKREQLAYSRILNSREYSFCCFSQERCEAISTFLR